MTFKLKEWEQVGELSHVSTEWGIYTDSNCTNELDYANTTVDLTMYTTNVVIPLNQTYYIRARRTLSDGTVLAWTPVRAITNEDTSSSLMLHSDIVIQSPHVVFNMDDAVDQNVDTLLISSGEYISKDTTHASTHWLITTVEGDIIFKSLYDEVNLTSLSINKVSLGLSSHNKYYISCIYVSQEGFESPIDRKLVILHNYNFTINDDLINIPPYIDYNINIDKIDQNSSNGIVGAALIAYNTTDILWSINYNVEIDTVVLPKSILLPGKEYILILSVMYNGRPISHRIKMSTRSNINSENIVLDYVPEFKQYDSMVDATTANYESVFNVTQLFDGSVILCSSDNSTAALYSLTSEGLLIFSKTLTTLGVITPSGFYTKLLEDNTLLINVNKTGTNIISLYDYDPVKRSVNNGVTLPLYTGSYTFGKNGGILYINNKIYALSPDPAVNEIFVIDIESKSIVKTLVPPNTVSTSRTMIDLGDNTLLLIGGEKNTHRYDIDLDEWTTGPGLPDALLDFDLLSLPYDNGDCIIYKLNDSTNNEENVVGIYKREDQSLTTITSDNFKLYDKFRGIINTVSGFKYIASIKDSTGDGISLKQLK